MLGMGSRELARWLECLRLELSRFEGFHCDDYRALNFRSRLGIGPGAPTAMTIERSTLDRGWV